MVVEGGFGLGELRVQPHVEADGPDARLSLGPDPASGVEGSGGAALVTGAQRSYEFQLHPWKPYKWEPEFRGGFSPGLGSGCSAVLLPSSLSSPDTCSQMSFIEAA